MTEVDENSDEFTSDESSERNGEPQTIWNIILSALKFFKNHINTESNFRKYLFLL
jgi:hypothetical protein